MEELGGGAYNSHAFDQDRILLPNVLFNDLNADVRPALKLALDTLWQAARFSRCSTYGADGQWKEK
jgi:hypothetical protein